MPYCADCGGQLHECEVVAPDPEAEAARAETKVAKTYTDAEVEIARLNAERDIAVARIQAGIIKDEVVVDAIAAEAEAEGVIEGVAPEPEEEPQPVVVVADADSESEAEPTLPEAEDQGTEPVTSSGKSSNPWW